MTALTTPIASASTPKPVNAPTLTGQLGVGSIVFMVIAAAAPLTVLGGGAPVGILLGNGAGFPATYLVAGATLALFTVGLSAMSRHIPQSGAFFAYVGRGLNPTIGVGAATLALTTYTAIQLSVYCLIGLQIKTGVQALIGIDLPWWVYSFAIVAIVAFLGYRHIEMSSKVLGLLLIAEISVVLIFSLVILGKGGAHGIDPAASFSPSAAFSGAPGVALMFTIASFIGFESTAVYRAEAKDPDRTIPRATYLAVGFVTVLYTISSFALVTAWGADGVRSAADSTLAAGNMLQVTAERYIGPWYSALISVLLITSLFACVLSFHNVLSRYMLALGHAGAMPRFLDYVHPHHESPSRASIVQTATASAILAVIALLGADPYAQGFTWLSGMATLGFVVLMALTCLAVLAFFSKHHREEGLWRTTIAPLLGTIMLAVFLYFIVANFPMLISDTDAAGNPQFGPATITLLGIMAASLVIGIAIALIIRRRNPKHYSALIDMADK